MSNDGFCAVLSLLIVGGANSYDAGPVSSPFRDGVEVGGGPLDKAEKRRKKANRSKMIFRISYEFLFYSVIFLNQFVQFFVVLKKMMNQIL